MRRGALKSSGGTRWPTAVRLHVETHQRGCLGAAVNMPGPCAGALELDHIRASGGIGMKSLSIAVNAARTCTWHHSIKTREGRTWRPKLIAEVARLASECSDCQRESIEAYGTPLSEVAA